MIHFRSVQEYEYMYFDVLLYSWISYASCFDKKKKKKLHREYWTGGRRIMKLLIRSGDFLSC